MSIVLLMTGTPVAPDKCTSIAVCVASEVPCINGSKRPTACFCSPAPPAPFASDSQRHDRRIERNMRPVAELELKRVFGPAAESASSPSGRRRNASTYLAGTNTRQVRRALAALFGGAVGKNTMSRTWRKVKND
jgi:hypothetical protein